MDEGLPLTRLCFRPTMRADFAARPFLATAQFEGAGTIFARMAKKRSVTQRALNVVQPAEHRFRNDLSTSFR
jgi:hypothetical protein